MVPKLCSKGLETQDLYRKYEYGFILKRIECRLMAGCSILSGCLGDGRVFVFALGLCSRNFEV